MPLALRDKAQQEDTSQNLQTLNSATKGSDSKVTKEPISEKEAVEFLKLIKHNEYNIVDQLNKQPTKIFMLSILLNFKAQRNAFLKVLNKACVSPDIFIGQLDHLVNNIMADNYISFSDNEIP